MASNPMTQFNVHRIGPEIKIGTFDTVSAEQQKGHNILYIVRSNRVIELVAVKQKNLQCLIFLVEEVNRFSSSDFECFIHAYSL